MPLVEKRWHLSIYGNKTKAMVNRDGTESDRNRVETLERVVVIHTIATRLRPIGGRDDWLIAPRLGRL